jgi:hypothetical protein
VRLRHDLQEPQTLSVKLRPDERFSHLTFLSRTSVLRRIKKKAGIETRACYGVCSKPALFPIQDTQNANFARTGIVLFRQPPNSDFRQGRFQVAAE